MDLTVDCKIKFIEAVFIGRYPKAKFDYNRTITGTIIKDSYGAKTGQHTFTITVESCDEDPQLEGTDIKRKGRNVYKNCVVLEYPENHNKLANEKHERSNSVKGSIAMHKAFEKGDYTAYENHENFFK